MVPFFEVHGSRTKKLGKEGENRIRVLLMHHYTYDGGSGSNVSYCSGARLGWDQIPLSTTFGPASSQLNSEKTCLAVHSVFLLFGVMRGRLYS